MTQQQPQTRDREIIVERSSDSSGPAWAMVGIVLAVVIAIVLGFALFLGGDDDGRPMPDQVDVNITDPSGGGSSGGSSGTNSGG